MNAILMARTPFTEWSDTDHAGPVIIITVLGLVYWLVPGVGQQIISFNQTNVLSWADRLHLSSMLGGLAQALVLLVAASKGLGKSKHVLSDDNADGALRIYHASNVLYVLVLGLAKCSAACSIISLTVPDRTSIRSASRKNKTFLAAVMALSMAWTIGCILVLGLQCEPGSTGATSVKSCRGKINTWAAIFAGDGLTDIVIVLFAASIIWPTRARFRLKVIWFVPYIIRLGVVVVAGARLAAFDTTALANDATIAVWLFVILTQIQVFCSLIATGFPAIKRTVLAMATNFGVSEDSQSRSRKGTSYALSSLKKSSRPSQAQESQNSFPPYIGGSRGNTVRVRAAANGGPSDDDSQKGILRHDEFDISIETASVRK